MPHQSPDILRQDAIAIWQAGLEAVRSERLVREAIRLDGKRLLVGEKPLDLDRLGRVAVVGAGKAGAGMAAAVEEILAPRLAARLTGWVHVPEDCLLPTRHIHLHPARPAGVNEPTPEGVAGAAEMLGLVESLGPNDLCLCLISGGASALLPAPVEGITLEDKLAVTRHLSASGATIEELNTVRKQLSRIKGGGLARHCGAGKLIALVISDVLGDPLSIIGSGPTVEDDSTPRGALAVLERFRARQAGIAPRVFGYLERKAGEGVPHRTLTRARCEVTNRVIGNNATAADAAGLAAVARGYSPAVCCAPRSEGPAEEVGRHLAEMALGMRSGTPDCLVSGGEPVVTLVEASRRGRGGRNQQLVLAALERLWGESIDDLVLLSAGTDGEDGPTDAAGALLDGAVLAEARRRGLIPAGFLARNDAYHFFEPLGALLKTGPTHTNVCDLRVVLVRRESRA